MAEKGKIGAKIVLDGEKEYRNALKGIAAEQKSLRSELKLCETEFRNNQNSADALGAKHEILTKQITAQAQKVEICAAAHEKSAERQKKSADKVGDLREQLKKAEDAMQQMKESTDATDGELEEQQAIINKLQDKLTKAEAGYTRAQTATKKWEGEVYDAKAELSNLNEDLRKNEKYMGEAEKSSDQTAASIDKYGKEVKEASDKTETFGAVLNANLASTVLLKAVDALSDGIVNISKNMVGVGADFEDAMGTVAATMGMTRQQIEGQDATYVKLENAAKHCGETTQFSATQAAEGLNYLALAGLDANKQVAVLPKTLDLAAAGNLDLGYSCDIVTDTMSALGLSTDDLDVHIDQMARTAQRSNTSIAQLGEAQLQCAGMIYATEQPLDVMNAELGILANNGIKGAEGGTHLRNVIERLVVPTEKGAAALESLGVKAQDSDGNVRELNLILDDLNKGLSNVSQYEKVNLIKTIFKETDITAVNSLLKGTGEEFENLQDELKNCKGAAHDMADTMNADLKGKVTLLKSALEGLGITAYEKIEGTLKDSVDAATDSVGDLQESMEEGRLGEAMDDFAESLGEAAEKAIEFGQDALPGIIEGLTWVLDHSELVIAGISGITAATVYHSKIGPMIESTITAWKSYKAAAAAAAEAQEALNLAQFANPAGILITAIVGLTTAIGIYALTAEKAVSKEQELIDKHQEAIDKIKEDTEKRKENQAELANEKSVIAGLSGELQKLNQKEKLTNEEKSKMASIVEELNQAMPDLNLTINEQTGLLNATNEELKNMIDNQLQLMEVEAAQEDLRQIAQEKYEAEKELAAITEERSAKQEELTEIEAKYQEELKNNANSIENCTALYADGITPLEGYTIKIREGQDVIAAYDEQAAQLQEQINGLGTEFQGISESIYAADEAMAESANVQVEYKGTTFEVSQSVAESISTIQQSYDDAKTKAEESFAKQIGLFEELSVKSELSAAQMKKALESQIEGYGQYADDLVTATKMMNEGSSPEFEMIVKNLMSMGIDGAGYLHTLIDAAQNDQETFNGIMQDFGNLQEVKDSMYGSIAEINTGYGAMMDGILGVQDEKNPLMEGKVEDTAGNIVKTMDDMGGATVENAEKSMDGVRDAISKKGDELNTQVQGVLNHITETANQMLEMSEGKSQKFIRVGRAIPDSMAEGIRSGESSVTRAMHDLVNNAINSVNVSGITNRMTEKVNQGLASEAKKAGRWVR